MSLRPVPSVLFASLLACLPLSAMAESSDPHALPHALDDRWEISGAWFHPDVSISGRANVQVAEGTDTEAAAGFARRSEDFNGGQLEATFRPSQRQRIVAGWYGVGNDRTVSIDESGTYVPEDGGEPLDYSIDGQGRFDTHFELYRLSYGYDVIQTPRTTVTALVGVYGAKIETDLNTSGIATLEDESVDLTGHVGWSETKHAPGLGLAVSYRPADRWEIRAGAQGFETSWGDFGTDGHFVHATAQVGYDLTPTWTVFAGYDHFDLKLEDSVSASFEQDGTEYSVDGPVSARLKVQGPTLGVRARF